MKSRKFNIFFWRVFLIPASRFALCHAQKQSCPFYQNINEHGNVQNGRIKNRDKKNVHGLSNDSLRCCQRLRNEQLRTKLSAYLIICGF